MKLPSRLTIVHSVLVVFAVALIGKAVQVQIIERDKWRRLAEMQHTANTSLPAPRGTIVDAGGVPLAQSQELVRFAVAPQEVEDTRALSRALLRAGIDRATARRAVDKKRKWVEVHRSFLRSDVKGLLEMRGVHAEAVEQRVYVRSEGVRKIIGRTDRDGAAVDGLELALDSLLRGARGRAAAFRGARGERYESPSLLTEPPRPGHTVALTINYTLQGICDQALVDATTRLHADGGDIVVLDPRTGDIRCLASRRPGGRGTASTALTEPFEPGSTLKPLFVGALIERGLATPDSMIDTYKGEYTTFGRTIHDVHKADRLSLADVIRYSSNVGIVRFAEQLSNRHMYEILRDYGFGTPTGIPYPSEASGTLREPRRWSAQSHASHAMGYEIAVTPLQLAAAYGAIANGGVLMQPALIASIRDADGKDVYVHRPRPVRRVLQPQTAERLRDIMQSVVDSGTATDAGLSTFNVAGKSGTARRTVGGRYAAGAYTASFVGIFPAGEPQYVVLVKLDNPRGTYYGGKTAAPVAKAVLEAAIAARDASLDRRTLIAQRAPYVPPRDTVTAVGGSAGNNTTPQLIDGPLGPESDSTANGEHVDVAPVAPSLPLVDSAADLPSRPSATFDITQPMRDAPRPDTLVVIPSVQGLPLRVAVRELHRAGVRVTVVGAGNGTTTPSAGTRVRAGSLVRLTRP